MPYDPKIHHRRSIRLKGYDYSQAGSYFITICCQDMKCRFGEIKITQPGGNVEMILNEYGQIAYDEWAKLPERFLNVELDVFQIMPNHMHGIIVLKDVGGPAAGVAPAAAGAGASPDPTTFTPPTVSDIVGAYKSLVANGCLAIYKLKNQTMGKLWQRDYYEHIIRNEKAYHNISNYILNNPNKWAEDKFFKK